MYAGRGYKQQSRQPCGTGGFAFSPYAPSSSAAQKGIVGAIEPEWQQQEQRTPSLERLRRGTPGPTRQAYTRVDLLSAPFWPGLFVHKGLILAHVEISLFHYLGRKKLC